MKFFVTSHGREHTATTPHHLEGLDWYFLLHRHADADRYADAGWPRDRIRVTNTVPGVYAQTAHRAVAYQNILEMDEWGVFMDDDIKDFRFHPTGERNQYRRVSGDVLYAIADDARKMAERLGFHLFGTALPMTEQRWLTVGGLKQSWMGWQKVDKPFPLDLRVRHEEMLYTAEHLLRDGGIALDTWLNVRNLRYSEGGLGPFSQRYEQKVESAKFLQRRYAGLVDLTYSHKATDREKFPEPSEVRLRLRTPRSVSNWRRQMLRRSST